MDSGRKAQSVTYAEVRPKTPYDVEPYGTYQAFHLQGRPMQLVQFPNTAAMVNYVEQNNDTWKRDPGFHQEFMKWSLDDEQGDNEWTFGSYHTNAKQTWDAISHGKPSDMYQKIVDRAIDEIKSDPEFSVLLRTVLSHKKKRKFVESGNELSIDRAMAGDSACWTVKSQSRKVQAVRLSVGLTMTGGNAEKDFMSVLIAVTKATYLINSLGLPVEIVGETFVSDYLSKTTYSDLAGITVTLKRAEDPLDYAKLATYFTPGMCRMVVFKLREAMFSGTKSGGMGTTAQISDSVKDFLKIDYSIGKNWSKGKQKMRLTSMIRDLISRSSKNTSD